MNALAQKNKAELDSPHVLAFLDTIAKSEGTDKTGNGTGYNVLVGGTRIKDLSRHPMKVVAITMRGKVIKSSACGRYQFLGKTWKPIALRLDLPDFGPESQDLAAIELLRECGALPLIRQDLFTDAVYAARKIWASFPGAGYGQPENSISVLAKFYEKRLKAHQEDSISNDVDSATPTPAELPTESPNLVQSGTVSNDGPPATVAATIPAVPPLPTEVPSGLSRFFKWVGGLSIGSYVGSLAVFKDHPELLGPLLALLKIVFVGLSGVGAVVAVMFFIERIAKARQSNELNQTRLTTFADPSLVNVDLKGWKSPQGEVKQ